MNRDELRNVIADLDRIDEAGETENLCSEVAYALRDRPANPKNAIPMGLQLIVDRLASQAARLLRIPLSETLPAALALFGVSSREQIVVDIIRCFAARLGDDVRPPQTQSNPSPQRSRPVTVNVRRSRKAGRYGR
ncbi:MAG: hypothetical protein LLF97_08275 [Planctomycetaceae bacterium]|nr:hypothetical protein [Planctomycetaceae bacterium]